MPSPRVAAMRSGMPGVGVGRGVLVAGGVMVSVSVGCGVGVMVGVLVGGEVS